MLSVTNNKPAILEKMENDDNIELFVKIMQEGLVDDKCNIIKSDIIKDFPLSTFPIILNIILDANDFLAGMRNVTTSLEKVNIPQRNLKK